MKVTAYLPNGDVFYFKDTSNSELALNELDTILGDSAVKSALLSRTPPVREIKITVSEPCEACGSDHVITQYTELI